MLGSLAGIGEIAKATFGGDGTAAAAPPRRRGGRPVRPPARPDGSWLMEQRHDGVDRLARRLELVHPGGAAVRCSRCSRPASSCCGSGSAAILVGIISLRRRLVVAGAAHRLRGVRRSPAIPVWRHFARKVEQPADQPVPQPPRRRLCRARVHARQADRRRRRHDPHRRHGLARARARTARPAAASRSRAPTARTCWWRRRSESRSCDREPALRA